MAAGPTGCSPAIEYPGSVPDVNSMSRADMPHMGSILAKLAPGNGPMFPFAIVPHRMDVAGGRRAGQFAGSLGGRYDPLLTGGNPNDDDFRLNHLPLAPNEDVDGAAPPADPGRSARRPDAAAARAGDQPEHSRQSGAGPGCDFVGRGSPGRRPGRHRRRPSANAMAATCSANRCCWAGGCSMRGLAWCSATGSAPRAATASPGTRTGTTSPPTRKIWFRPTIRPSTP